MPPRRNYTQAQVDQLVANALLAERRRSESAETPPTTHAAKPCSYKDFLSCKPLYFKGTEGAIGLLRWIERMESVFSLCNCAEDSKVKFAAYTFQEGALTWWNTHANSVGIEIANRIPWSELKKKLKEKYCREEELHRLEVEFWQLTVQGNDIADYTTKFQQFALLCPGLVDTEGKSIKKYIRGLPENIQGNVASARPTTLEGAIGIAHELMAMIASREASTTPSGNNKRKAEENLGNQSQANKRTVTVKSNTTEPDNKIGYKGKRPYCAKCSLHHDGVCPCTKCKRFGHVAKDCKTVTTDTNTTTSKTCFECNGTGHFKKDCPQLKNKGNTTARGRAYVVKAKEDDQNPRLIDILNEGTDNLTYSYADYMNRYYLLLDIRCVFLRFCMFVRIWEKRQK